MGKGALEESLFVFGLSAALPLETSPNLCSLQAQCSSGPGDEHGGGGGLTAWFHAAPASTKNGGPTAYRWQHGAAPAARTVRGPGEHREQTGRRRRTLQP